MDKINENNDNSNDDKEIELETELDREVLDLIFKLYDGTFRDLVDR